MEVVVRVSTRVYLSNSEREAMLVTRDAFVDNLNEAKEKLRRNSEDYNALVDVNFYRLALRRMNRLLKQDKPRYRKHGGKRRCLKK